MPCALVSLVSAAVLAAGLLAVSGPSAAGLPQAVPVKVGGDAQQDACGSTGVVSGLRPVPGNRLAVRRGPGTEYPKVAELPAGRRVWLCDARDGWLGVVFGGEGQECGVSSPQAERSAYGGPCPSGWVSKRYITLEAG